MFGVDNWVFEPGCPEPYPEPKGSRRGVEGHPGSFPDLGLSSHPIHPGSNPRCVSGISTPLDGRREGVEPQFLAHPPIPYPEPYPEHSKIKANNYADNFTNGSSLFTTANILNIILFAIALITDSLCFPSSVFLL